MNEKDKIKEHYSYDDSKDIYEGLITHYDGYNLSQVGSLLPSYFHLGKGIVNYLNDYLAHQIAGEIEPPKHYLTYDGQREQDEQDHLFPSDPQVEEGLLLSELELRTLRNSVEFPDKLTSVTAVIFADEVAKVVAKECQAHHRAEIEGLIKELVDKIDVLVDDADTGDLQLKLQEWGASIRQSLKSKHHREGK